MSMRAIAAHWFWYIDPDIGSPLHSSYVGTKVPRACCGLLSLDVKLLRLGFMPTGITKGRAMSCSSLGGRTPAATGMFNAASDWAARRVITIKRHRNGAQQMSAQTETKSGKQCA
jgi:hypothetical protein